MPPGGFDAESRPQGRKMFVFWSPAPSRHDALILKSLKEAFAFWQDDQAISVTYVPQAADVPTSPVKSRSKNPSAPQRLGAAWKPNMGYKIISTEKEHC